MTSNQPTPAHPSPASPEYGLAEGQRRMQHQLMESTGVAESVFNLKTQQLSWNRRAYEVFGVSPVGSPITLEVAMHLVYPDDLERLVNAREQMRHTPGSLTLDYRVIRPDGTLVEVHTLLYAETDLQGRALAHVEMTLDVTERKRIETALIQSARLCRVLDKVSTDGYWEESAPVQVHPTDALVAPDVTPPTGNDTAKRKIRVLYVEDNMYNLMLFDDVMRTRDDVEVRMAQNGAQGFEVAGTWQPDVLVLDGRLPDTHGIALLQRMRGIEGLQTTPAFMCSADTQPEHKVLAEQAGFAGYWTKPVDFDKVFDELDRVAANADLRQP
ncbi:response regulator [Polaromonas sp.]|uniref:response regulator n=1 Tax=Polaromonas sp. TaxID=1869339 RepID=UPI0027301281|nr:response regulator [Polaromonas sp.]MDP1739590.1 response regulator [Polaromonas sp.]